MLALGASDRSILRIVLLEGILTGAMSWLLWVALAFSVGGLVSSIVGNAFLRNPQGVCFCLEWSHDMVGSSAWYRRLDQPRAGQEYGTI